MGPYIALGLNGAIGSTDAVHIHWDKCPAGHKTFFQGKEGFPTIVFNVTVTHDGKAMHVSSSAYGSCNDKTLVRFDEFIHLLRTHPRYTKIKYELFISPGNSELAMGVYVLVDGGYHLWKATMSASRTRAEPAFSE
jgi:hypothetical protein